MSYLYLKVRNEGWNYETTFITKSDFDKQAQSYDDYLKMHGHSGINVITNEDDILTISQHPEIDSFVIKVPIPPCAISSKSFNL